MSSDKVNFKRNTPEDGYRSILAFYIVSDIGEETHLYVHIFENVPLT